MIRHSIAYVAQGSPMMLLGFRHLALVLIVTLLFCHGVFGSLHLLCYSRQCPGDAEHAMEHNTSVSEMGDGPEHPVGQVASKGNFAVLAVGFLGLPLGSLPKVAPLRLTLEAFERSSHDDQY